MAGLGFLKGLSTALDTYQDQIDRQSKMKLAQIEMQQKQVELQAMQQQAQLAGWQGKLDYMATMAEAQGDPQPPAGPYEIRQPQIQGGGQSGGGLPGARPMPQQGQMSPMPPMMAGAGRPPAPQMGGGQPQGAPAMSGGQPQQQPQQPGAGGLPPPPTVQGIAQAMAQRAQQMGMRPPPQAIMQAAQKAYPQAMEQWKAKAEQVRMQTQQAIQQQRNQREDQHEAFMESMDQRRLGMEGARLGIEERRLKDSEATTGGLPDETVDYLAQRYRMTGQMPPLGMGKQAAGMREQILQRAADQSKAAGGDAGSDVADAAATKANTQSLGNLTKMTDAATSFESTASKNFDTALKLAPKAIPTNMGPWLNKWIEGGQSALGNKDVPPYVAALLTGANEYAKIMSGSTGSQGSTVDSRREAAAMFSPSMNYDQIQAVIQVAKQDMSNRRASLNEQLSTIKSRISGKPGPSEAASPSSDGWKIEPVH